MWDQKAQEKVFLITLKGLSDKTLAFGQRYLPPCKKHVHLIQGASGTDTKNFDSGSGIAGTGILAGKKTENL